LVLAVVEPPFATLLGADPNAWSGAALLAAGALCVGICAVIGLSARGTGS
jgi:hypothetical protein